MDALKRLVIATFTFLVVMAILALVFAVWMSTQDHDKNQMFFPSGYSAAGYLKGNKPIKFPVGQQTT